MKSYDHNTINIRMVQHYMYCPRRYGLLELNSDWSENAAVIKADIMHEKVHSGEHEYSGQNKIALSSVVVYNDEPQYDLYGVTDCMEFEHSSKGAYIESLGGNYKVKIIEYKPQPPKSEPFHQSDAIQVFAQKICADSVFGCDCECFIYYASTRKRILLPFDTEYDTYNNMLLSYLSQMREIFNSQIIPQKRRGQKCSGCSLNDKCCPKEIKKTVREMISSADEQRE